MHRQMLRLVMLLAAGLTVLVFATTASGGQYVNSTVPAQQWRYSPWNYWYYNEDFKGCYCFSVISLERSDRTWGLSDSDGYAYIDVTYFGGFGGYLRGVIYSGNIAYWHDARVGQG